MRRFAEPYDTSRNPPCERQSILSVHAGVRVFSSGFCPCEDKIPFSTVSSAMHFPSFHHVQISFGNNQTNNVDMYQVYTLTQALCAENYTVPNPCSDMEAGLNPVFSKPGDDGRKIIAHPFNSWS